MGHKDAGPGISSFGRAEGRGVRLGEERATHVTTPTFVPHYRTPPSAADSNATATLDKTLLITFKMLTFALTNSCSPRNLPNPQEWAAAELPP